jgi:hypothetical protein
MVGNRAELAFFTNPNPKRSKRFANRTRGISKVNR